MAFYNESWFWAGIIPLAASFGTVWLTGKTRLKLERLRLHENEVLKAHKELYKFISFAFSMLFPPDEPRRNFIAIMKDDRYQAVRRNLLYFVPDIRRIVRELESQFACVGDADLSPAIPFDEFMGKHLVDRLQRLEALAESRTDAILHRL